MRVDHGQMMHPQTQWGWIGDMLTICEGYYKRMLYKWSGQHPLAMYLTCGQVTSNAKNGLTRWALLCAASFSGCCSTASETAAIFCIVLTKVVSPAAPLLQPTVIVVR